MISIKKQILYPALILIFIGLCLGGIFGIALAILVISVYGLVLGIYKKEQIVWKTSLAALIITLSGSALFFYLLSISNM